MNAVELQDAPISVTGSTTPGAADLEWCIEDPLAVRAAFRISGDRAEWVISRDLLHRGVGSAGWVGEMCVKVSAGIDPDTTSLLLSSPDGAAEIVLANEHLIPFLDRCDDLCPLSDADDDSTEEAQRLAAQIDTLLIVWDLA